MFHLTNKSQLFPSRSLMLTLGDDDIKTKREIEKNLLVKIESDKTNGVKCSMKIKNQVSSSANKKGEIQVFWKFWMLERLSKFILSRERTVGADSPDAVPVGYLNRMEMGKQRQEEGEPKRGRTQDALEVDDATAASGSISVSPHSTSKVLRQEKDRKRQRERERSQRAAVVKAFLSDIDTSHIIRPSYRYSDSDEDYDSEHSDLGPDSNLSYHDRGESARSAKGVEGTERGSVEEVERGSIDVSDSSIGGYHGISVKLFPIKDDKAESEKSNIKIREELNFSENKIPFACLTNSLRALNTVISAVALPRTNCSGSDSGSGSTSGSSSEVYPPSSSTPPHSGLESEHSKRSIHNNSECQIFKTNQKLFDVLSVCLCAVLNTFISTLQFGTSVAAGPDETRIYFDTILKRNETTKFHLAQILSMLQYGNGRNLWSRICYTHRFSPLVLSFLSSIGTKGENEVVKEEVELTSAGQCLTSMNSFFCSTSSYLALPNCALFSLSVTQWSH
jgi:hypothetical protein